jgi:cyclic dehypoxanthinyl futalosine synthase
MAMKRLTRSMAKDFFAGDMEAIRSLANEVRISKHPERIVSYTIQRTVNYTNVCNAYCSFCSFYRPPGSKEGYVLGDEAIFRKIEEAIALGAVGIFIQGGDNPDLQIEYYERLFRAIKRRYGIWLHSLSASEITNLAAVSGLSLHDALLRLRDAGLDSIPGAGAEILDDEIRHRISPLKINTEQWLAVHRTAHNLGLRTTATMVFGFGEALEHRLNHLDRLRTLQDETGGFAAMVVWPYQIGAQHPSILPKEKPTDDDYLRMQALARAYLDNFENLQSSWLTVGLETGKRSLEFGANDVGSVVLEENVVGGAADSLAAEEAELRRAITHAGYQPMVRDSIYSRMEATAEAFRITPPAQAAR